jgi:hypothetical protein
VSPAARWLCPLMSRAARWLVWRHRLGWPVVTSCQNVLCAVREATILTFLYVVWPPGGRVTFDVRSYSKRAWTLIQLLIRPL